MNSPRYSSPTHNSLSRSRPPVHLQDRLVSLSEEVTRLKDNLELGLTATESLERNTEKQMEVMNSQISALKTAFVDLSEAIVGQLDQVKSELLQQAEAKVEAFKPQIDTFYTAMERNSEDYSRLEGRLLSFQHDTAQQLQELAHHQAILGKELSAIRGLLAASAERLDVVQADLKAEMASSLSSNE